MKRLSNKKLIKLCLDKDRTAWAQFVERFSRLIYWSIKYRIERYRFRCAEEDIEDIFQSIFLKLYSNDRLSALRDASSLDTWLVMVASNETMDYFKRKRRIREEPVEYLNGNAASDSSTENPERREIYEIAEEAVNSLPEKERMVITLNYLYGKKYKEVSHLLDIPLGTVSTVISKARQLIKSALKEKGIEDF